MTPFVWFWGSLAKRRNLTGLSAQGLQEMMADTHSLDAQRIYNVSCWALGFDPVKGANTAKLAELPESRAARCPAEYQRLQFGMQTQFLKYVKSKALPPP